MMTTLMRWGTALFFISMMSACTTNYSTRVDDSPGRPTVYEDVNSPGKVQGIGVESQDIAGMTDKMMRDMLATPVLAARQTAPYVIVDDKYFTNESATIMNKRLITERLMINLNRASMGRMVFVERAAASMVEKERALKRSGVVTGGTMGQTKKTAGADFRLTGRIMSQDSVNSGTGYKSRYNVITFKMIDLETSIAVWTGMYEFKKSTAEDVIYR
ncbi:MAG: penicillin-binding protein activator LpoB [Thermodesulfobacteriota bacterium]